MTHSELDALYALHDRWSAYDLAVAILTFGAGGVLVLLGIAAAVNDEGLIGLAAVIVGAVVVLVGLNKEPYQAR